MDFDIDDLLNDEEMMYREQVSQPSFGWCTN